MLLVLLIEGQVQLFILIIMTLIISISFHEFGHAYVAKLFGDDTASSIGRLTINPLAHISYTGLLMLIIIGIGFAKPVPIDNRRFTSDNADLFVAAAGPFMNLIIAIVMINLYVIGFKSEWPGFQGQFASTFFPLVTQINLILMIFNLLPIGPLDGHYIFPYFLPKRLAYYYRYYNDKYGLWVLLVLIVLSLIGANILQRILEFSITVQRWIVLFD